MNRSSDFFGRSVGPSLLSVLIGITFAPGYGTRVEAAVDLLEAYPTTLTQGDPSPQHARAWEFERTDIYRLTTFRLEVGSDLKIDLGMADVGIGHTADGAVWAVVLPRAEGKLISQAPPQTETISHVWLRFHPRELGRLFPPKTVFPDSNRDQVDLMRMIAGFKMRASWHAGNRVTIPEPKDQTVDVDTRGGPRRFFVVDREARTARYVAAFEKRSMPAPPVFDPAEAAKAFDQLWEAFDDRYALFVLRPEVDWKKLREQYRPQALRCASTPAFASVCAEMLAHLRDLHVWLRMAGHDVPVFNRPRTANVNPAAYRSLVGNLNQAGREMVWAVTSDQIGFVAIGGWTDPQIPARFGEALESMKDTRGLIVDVRLNGGGSEPLARKVAGRFLDREFIYAFSRYRNGPAHTNLTERIPRKAGPQGPWRCTRPVVLLIGQKCMSSNESFIAMMSGATNVVIMGDRTCGSSGNPEIVSLPFEMTVSVPRWIDYLPDGAPLDEHGFLPSVKFKPSPGAFENGRDDLLSAALERLRRAREF
jgi:Peptidase family S41/Tricorn protease C1 domain